MRGVMCHRQSEVPDSMNKKKLADWASIAEILTSVVVVVSLVYVGFELNQNTTAIQLSSHQGVIDRFSQADMMIASDKELHRIIASGERDPSSLSEEEWSRFSRYALPRIGDWEFLFLAERDNAISTVQWNAFERYFHHIACMSGYRKFWEENRISYAQVFQDNVDEVLRTECDI